MVSTARRNDAIGMQRAIDCGANVPSTVLLQESVLHGWDNTARLVLALGTISASAISTLLVQAVTNRYINVARVMLQHGVSADGVSRALYPAVLNNRTDMVELLLAYGADVRTIANPKRSFLTAIRSGNIQMMKVFLDADMLSGMTPCLRHGDPMYVVAKVGSVEMMELLLEYGASVDMRGKHGRTLLHQTVVCAGREAMLRFLLNSAVDMNAVDARGCTPLHLAVCRGNVAAVRILLEYGADVGSVKMHQWEPVYARASGRKSLGRSEDVKSVLVEFGVVLDG